MAASLVPYLSFDGTCAEAMRFYAELLGARLEALMTYGQAPGMADHVAEADRGLVMHAYLVHPDFTLMAGDGTCEMPYQKVQGISLALSFDTVDEARRVFEALGAGGQVTMPMGESFWAEVFGAVTDRFGISWLVNGVLKPMA
ncbi:MAG: VOC family protein [Burkholderiaceae bacterium]|nr:VOC family protein [Burkholderiaceae bacterium]